MGVIVGVAVIVTMVSFGLGLQRNMLSRFKALDLFNEMSVFGKNVFYVGFAELELGAQRRQPKRSPRTIVFGPTKRRRESLMMPRLPRLPRFPESYTSNPR